MASVSLCRNPQFHKGAFQWGWCRSVGMNSPRVAFSSLDPEFFFPWTLEYLIPRWWHLWTGVCDVPIVSGIWLFDPQVVALFEEVQEETGSEGSNTCCGFRLTLLTLQDVSPRFPTPVSTPSQSWTILTLQKGEPRPSLSSVVPWSWYFLS